MKSRESYKSLKHKIVGNAQKIHPTTDPTIVMDLKKTISYKEYEMKVYVFHLCDQ